MKTATKNENQEQKKSAPKQEKSSVSRHFKATIKAYLDKRAEEDELFAKTYAKENKNLEECCNYILQEVKKSGCHGFADEEIYNMAVHYYDEDEIKDVEPVSAVNVVVNHVCELTEEEKAEAREKARADYEKQQLAKIKEEERRREERERKRKEQRIQKAHEAAERQNRWQLTLFDM